MKCVLVILILIESTLLIGQDLPLSASPKKSINQTKSDSYTPPSPRRFVVKKVPKHIILIIGDGSGLAQWSAYDAKRTQGDHTSANGAIVFTDFPVFGLSFTQSANSFITDSGAGATAMSTGQKSQNGMIGLSADSTPFKTLSEIAHQNNKSTGIAVTCELTHATPAAFFAHQVSRESMLEIGEDFLKGSCIDVAMGGGKQYFDTVALVKAGYAVGTGEKAIVALQDQKRRVLFYDNQPAPPKAQEGRNSMGSYLEKACNSILRTMFQNPNGSFTMIEGSQIDWAGHDNDSVYLMAEMEDFDYTIREVLKMAKQQQNTLVVVSADHETGGLSLLGWDNDGKQPAMNFSSHHHSGIPVPVFAWGPGSEIFGGSYQNTEIFYKIKGLMELSKH